MVANSVNRSVMSDSVTPGTVARQAPLSTEFSRQEYWSGLAIPFPRGLPNPGIEPGSPALQADCLPSEPPGKPWETGEEYERMDRRNQNLLKKNLCLLIGYSGFSLLFMGFLWLRSVGTTLHCRHRLLTTVACLLAEHCL